jgi:hypothetical protein
MEKGESRSRTGRNGTQERSVRASDRWKSDMVPLIMLFMAACVASSSSPPPPFLLSPPSNEAATMLMVGLEASGEAVGEDQGVARRDAHAVIGG